MMTAFSRAFDEEEKWFKKMDIDQRMDYMREIHRNFP